MWSLWNAFWSSVFHSIDETWKLPLSVENNHKALNSSTCMHPSMWHWLLMFTRMLKHRNRRIIIQWFLIFQNQSLRESIQSHWLSGSWTQVKISCTHLRDGSVSKILAMKATFIHMKKLKMKSSCYGHGNLVNSLPCKYKHFLMWYFTWFIIYKYDI